MYTEKHKTYMREYMRKRINAVKEYNTINLKDMTLEEKRSYFTKKTQEYRQRKRERLIEEKRKETIK